MNSPWIWRILLRFRNELNLQMNSISELHFIDSVELIVLDNETKAHR